MRIFDGETERDATPEEEAQLLVDMEALKAPSNTPYKIEKLDLVLRLVGTEPDQIVAAKPAMGARLNLVWDTTTAIWSDSVFFDDLHNFLTQVFSAQRADELLARP